MGERLSRSILPMYSKKCITASISTARDQSSPHIIGTTGNEAWSNGQWSLTSQVKGGGPVERTGYWLEVYRLEGGTWKKRVEAWNVTPAPPPAATPSPTASPSNQ